MLKGFEDLTKDITDLEIEYAKKIALNLKVKCVGKENAVSNKRLREAILKGYGVEFSGIRIRRMINYIRSYNLVPRLCANNKGYFQAANDEEWEAWKKSMQQRINEMQNILDAASYFNDGKETL